MILWLFILLNSGFSNNFDVGNGFYQLPDYSENTYREVFALDIKNSFDINYEYLVLKTYFNIYEPVGFDSLENDSYGLRKRTLQAVQFQFDMKFNFMEFSVGRILNFEEYDFYSVDGFRTKFYFKNFSFSLIHGKEVNVDSFLGQIDFYDEKSRRITDYYISSVNLSVFYDESNSLSLKYMEYKDSDYLTLQLLRASLDINIWKISSVSMVKYLLTRQDFEQILFNFEIYDYGVEYEEYKPFFLNDSIFNIFVIDKYRRSSVYYNGKMLNLALFTENFDTYGVKANLKLFKNYYISSEYLYKEHFSVYLSSRFNMYASDYVNLVFNYFHHDSLDSLAFRSLYAHKLIQESFIKLYSDFIYNNYYKFQLRAGFLLSSYF